jgi:hypothetical protein
VRYALLLVLASAPALATPTLEVIEPASGQLAFGDVPIGVPTATQRIRMRNTGDTAGDIIEVRGFNLVVSGPTFVTLAPGEDAVWDVACLMPEPGVNGDQFFRVNLCDNSCEGTDLNFFVDFTCFGGFFDSGFPDGNQAAFADQHALATYSLTNRESVPVTITGLQIAAPFSTSLAVPFVVAPGERLDVPIDYFNPGALAGEYPGNVDLTSDAGVVGRIHAQGFTIDQIQGQVSSFEIVPQGAMYTRPLQIRNSSTATRTITSLAFDLPDSTVSNVVGTTLGPGETVDALGTLGATTLGPVRATLTVGFDSAQGDSAVFLATVVPPTFAVTTADATPDDGWLDFGTAAVATGPLDGSITIVNKLAVDRVIAGCDAPAPPFELVTPCPAAIPANGSVTLTIRATPGAPGDTFGIGAVRVDQLGAILLAAGMRVIDHAYASATTEVTFDSASSQTVTVSNVLDRPIALPVTVTGEGFRAEPTTLNVPAGGTADVTVTFSGTGDVTGTLAIGASDDPGRLVIALAGHVEPGMMPPPPGDDGGGCCQSSAPGASPLLALVVLLGLRPRRRCGDCANGREARKSCAIGMHHG